MNTLIQRFNLQMDRFRNFELSAHEWVIAYSGGLDSQVLLHLCAQYCQQYPQDSIKAIHIHHGLSPNADTWQKHCQIQCQSLDIPFIAQSVQLDLKSKQSLEKQARDARYKAIEAHLSKNSHLLVAQHASDQLETFLLALKRGSGPKGLSSMGSTKILAKGELNRPLLEFSREDLYQYATSHQLIWITDESNQDLRFDRNFIRHQVAPVLKNRWPEIEKTVSRSAALCAEQELLISELLQKEYQAALMPDLSLSISYLINLSEKVRNALLRYWFCDQNILVPSRRQLDQIWQDVALAKADAMPVFSLPQKQIGRYQDHLYLYPKYQDISHIRLKLEINKPLSLPDGLGFLCLNKKHDSSALELFLTKDECSDLFVCFGQSFQDVLPQTREHRRSMKKLWQEYQVPPWLRKRYPQICIVEHLIAVAGLFTTKFTTKQKNHSLGQLKSKYYLHWQAMS